MKRVLIVLLALFGGLALVLLVGVLLVVLVRYSGKGSVARQTILEIDLEKGLVEFAPDDPLSAVLGDKAMTVRELVEALHTAARDENVKGLVARVGTSGMGMARVQEIRDAVRAFAESGKFTIAWSETFGEFQAGSAAYYLASAFDEIYMQPSGDLGLTGFIAESPFLRGTLEKLGVTPRMDQRYEYKNAMNMWTERAYTPPHREAMQSLLDSWFGQMVRDVAKARKMTEAQVRATVDRAPLLGEETVQAKLVDGLAYRDEVFELARDRAAGRKTTRPAGDARRSGTRDRDRDGDEGAEFLYLSKYLSRADRIWDEGDTIAVVYGVGVVMRGTSGYDPLFGDQSMGSDTVASALRAAVDDEDVKAILFRVDSPGGSYVASDTIWRETVRAREAGKPVIVSMGDVAASGGYFVSMSADKIVAQPGTITGSIGVLAGKMLTTGMWDKVGLSWDEVHVGEHATMWTGTHDYSEAEWARFQAWLDRIYTDFTGKVAQGRKLPPERVLQIAKGRIWTGEQAKGLGLVDEVGGLTTALRLARQAAKIDDDAPVRLRQFPPPKSPWARFFEEGPDSSEDEGKTALARALQIVQPIARQVRLLGAAREPGMLRLAPEVEAAVEPAR